jgi:hypothetical protein
MTEPTRPPAELAEREIELARLREEYMARFRTDPDIAKLDVDEAIATIHEALRSGRPIELRTP